MLSATAAEVCSSFINGWVRNFGLPGKVSSDNGKAFQARLWQDLNTRLGTIVSYSPLYSPSSVGTIERQHGPLKQGLKAFLSTVGDVYGKTWPAALPWVLLGRRTAYHEELGATPAELVFGTNPALPGDITQPLTSNEPIETILQKVKENAQRAPCQTKFHRTPPFYMPESTRTCTHVWVKRAKKTPLGQDFDGPYEIVKRIGDTSLEVKVGEFVNGTAQTEIRHWHSCQPAPPPEQPVSRPTLGRPRKQ